MNIEDEARAWIRCMLDQHSDMTRRQVVAAIRAAARTESPQVKRSTIAALMDEGLTAKEIAERTGLSMSAAYCARNRVKRDRGVKAHPGHIAHIKRINREKNK